MESNLPEGFREEPEMSPEEEVALEESKQDDMDDNSDDVAKENGYAFSIDEQEEFEASQEQHG